MSPSIQFNSPPLISSVVSLAILPLFFKEGEGRFATFGGSKGVSQGDPSKHSKHKYIGKGGAKMEIAYNERINAIETVIFYEEANSRKIMKPEKERTS